MGRLGGLVPLVLSTGPPGPLQVREVRRQHRTRPVQHQPRPADTLLPVVDGAVRVGDALPGLEDLAARRVAEGLRQEQDLGIMPQGIGLVEQAADPGEGGRAVVRLLGQQDGLPDELPHRRFAIPFAARGRCRAEGQLSEGAELDHIQPERALLDEHVEELDRLGVEALVLARLGDRVGQVEARLPLEAAEERLDGRLELGLDLLGRRERLRLPPSLQERLESVHEGRVGPAPEGPRLADGMDRDGIRPNGVFHLGREGVEFPVESGLDRLGLPADPPFPLRSQQDGLEPAKQAGSGLHLAAVRPPGAELPNLWPATPDSPLRHRLPRSSSPPTPCRRPSCLRSSSRPPLSLSPCPRPAPSPCPRPSPCRRASFPRPRPCPRGLRDASLARKRRRVVDRRWRAGSPSSTRAGWAADGVPGAATPTGPHASPGTRRVRRRRRPDPGRRRPPGR